VIRRVSGPGPAHPDAGAARAPQAGFQQALAEALRLSNHAQQRVHSRGLAVSPEQAQRVTAAVEAARQKGCRNAVVLVDGVAFVVSVPASTVVTVMPADRLRVFTNIDGAVIA
jgi:flagellar operon protein